MNTQILNKQAFVCVLAVAALSVLAVGCGKGQEEEHTPVVDVGPFASYVTSFEQDAAAHGASVKITDLKMQFGKVDIDGETGGRGVCEVATNMTPVITIDQTAWESSDEDERQELIYHELGHCVLNKTHEEGTNSIGIPASIMNPYKIDGSIYAQYRSFYLSKLFK